VNGGPLRADRDIAAVEKALSAAAIPPAQRGSARLRRLAPAERRLYLWILQRFATARPPGGQQTRDAAEGLGLDRAAALATFAREDLVHADPSGRPTVAYPFSADSRGHRVLIDGQRWVEAMCAIDALGIGPMLELPIEIASRDPLDGGEVCVRLDSSDESWWDPAEAAVLAGSTCGEGPSLRGCCDVLNYQRPEPTSRGAAREHWFQPGLRLRRRQGRLELGGAFARGRKRERDAGRSAGPHRNTNLQHRREGYRGEGASRSSRLGYLL
jgi:hypothetical protein